MEINITARKISISSDLKVYIEEKLHKLSKYDNFEFRSPVDVWDVQQEYKADFDKVKVLDVELNEGEIIYIPAYWWYSIKYEKLSSICCFKYRTFD